ncbi:hypothetical protein HanRHA438_Chr15g0715651 [Helianthus annuus]|uniref:Uncharacterized protein n=1 Tax=Helianthus annuus TaxID=4232 RepID=A0A9K3E263_HELAN|nr:hypothetical protein HanXRQr2_Chr15g0703301 [Helianthus annuus]KAJ0451932.1 hypothetical protein HanHA300_Chr15g0573231 [Helianthus annuus]KAJ0456656.1 hypothetical protein HanIR_Chr15g0764961 [Helianthus annuus]KAJ0473816.1 hypothetical protein HanHA89_Chr15g0622701 [Helianthus annuus]KAJ0649391.1 hypothetical protein HanLR1_Chr15g0583781 [Helianthus annuus]
MKGVSLKKFEYTLILYHTKHSCCYLYLFIVVRNKLSDDGLVDDSHVIPLLFKVLVCLFGDSSRKKQLQKGLTPTHLKQI